MSAVVFPTSEINSTIQEVKHEEHEESISPTTLLHVLNGVGVATKTSDSDLEPIVKWISGLRAAQSSRDWVRLIDAKFSDDECLLQLTKCTLAVSILRNKCRPVDELVRSIDQGELSFAWSLVHDALTSPALPRPLFNVSRSAQGFLAIPLCSSVVDGNIDELFRLHVWLPDGQRGASGYGVHSHQPTAHSWILAGEGRDHRYSVQRVDDASNATNAEYALSWNDGKGSSIAYKTHQSSSAITNTGVLVRATHTSSASHTRNMYYGIPSAHFHRSEVPPNECHSTFFFFDSRRGFFKDARVLGPVDDDVFEQSRDPAGNSAAELGVMVESMRTWETLMAEGKQHAARAEWELALRAYNSALSVCQREKFPNSAYYQSLVLGQLGCANRRFGRYGQAKTVLEAALAKMPPNQARVDLSVELGVVLRHMDRLADAKRAFEDSCHTATQLGLKSSICRALGNLGMVNFQLFKKLGVQKRLEEATSQLTERVQRARDITKELNAQPVSDENTRKLRDARTWECIGLSRLSLCYSVRGLGQLDKAIDAAYQSLELASKAEDPTMLAMSRYFYGRVLSIAGRHDEALQQFNARGDSGCTAAIALCKEPSTEHRLYLQELVVADADLQIVDGEGYSALDYAVFGDDQAAIALVCEGLGKQLTRLGINDVTGQLERRKYEARLRKGYRELFQDQLRPVLTSAAISVQQNDNLAARSVQTLSTLRKVYAQALASDKARAQLFDPLKVLRYTDLLNLRRLPRSSDGMTAILEPPQSNDDLTTSNETTSDFVIFASYRWLNGSGARSRPDDDNNTQYDRLVNAVESLLKLHPSLDRNRLSIWLDYTCVDQDNPAAGVAALPLLLAQCNAVVSLLDETYMRRAWCCVEVAMIQILKRSYGLHIWYMQQEDGTLKPSDIDVLVSAKDKELSFEADRPSVAFLERQSRLLGQT